MKKLCFMTVLMLALAVPAMASGGTWTAIGGLGDFCHVEGSPLTLNLGAPDFVGPVTTPGVGVVNANIPCTITCAIEAGGVPDRVVGQNTGHSMVAGIAWDGDGQAMAVAPPQINTPHPFTITVTRSGYADLSDSYSCTIILDTIP